MGQQQNEAPPIYCSVTIAFKRSYICGNYNSTHYYAQNNGTGNYELISTDAAQTISYAISKLTPGRTWQETVVLKGTFSIGTTITLSAGDTLLDFSQANVTVTSSVTAFQDYGGNNTFYGGGTYDFANDVYTSKSVWTGVNGASAIYIYAQGSTIDGFEFSGFSGGSAGVAIPAIGSSYVTIENCWYHNVGSDTTLINICGGGYDQFLYNKLQSGISSSDRGWTCIMDNGHGKHQTIMYNDFSGFFDSGAHAIYSDRGDAPGGYNVVAFNRFHDITGGAGYQVKTNNNLIYNNTFINMPSSTAPPISLYSELSGYTANDNQLYNNTVTNCYYFCCLGHEDDASPTLRNLFYDNVFTNVTNVFEFITQSNVNSAVVDTKIYYNDFHNCGTAFTTWTPTTTATLFQNTVIAYNYIDEASTVPTMANTMIYYNTLFPPSTTLVIANSNYNNVINASSWYYVVPRTT
jgi:hypothetical protein